MNENIFSGFKTLESLNREKAQIDEQYNERKQIIELVSEAQRLEDKPFGYIKDAFENLSTELFETKYGRKLLSMYVKTINENKSLSKLHSAYESVRKANAASDIDYFVSELSKSWGINENEVKSGCNRLGQLLSEAYIITGQEKAKKLLPESKDDLYEAVESIVTKDATLNRLSEHSKSVKVLKDYISNNKSDVNESKKPISNEDFEKMISNFNEKYTNELSEEEQQLIKDISECIDREITFNKYKEICSNKLEEQKANFESNKDFDSAKKIGNLMESLSKKTYSNNTFLDDIMNLFEMSQLFD